MGFLSTFHHEMNLQNLSSTKKIFMGGGGMLMRHEYYCMHGIPSAFPNIYSYVIYIVS